MEKEKTMKIIKGVAIGVGCVLAFGLGAIVGGCSVNIAKNAENCVSSPASVASEQNIKRAPTGLTWGDLVGSTWYLNGITTVHWSSSIGLGVPSTNGATTRLYLPKKVSYDYNGESYTGKTANFAIYRNSSTAYITQFVTPQFYYQSSAYSYANINNSVLNFSNPSLIPDSFTFESGDVGSDDIYPPVDVGVFYDWAIAQGFTTDYGQQSSSEESSGSDSASSEGSSESQREYSEVMRLGAQYDYRKWIGEVDVNTGLINYRALNGADYFVFGGVEWINLDNGRRYNFVAMVVTNILSGDETYVMTKDNIAYSASELYGNDWNQFSRLAYVYYGYANGYDGETLKNDVSQLNVEYRDTIYMGNGLSSYPNSSGVNVSAFDVRNVYVPSLYRNMGIVRDNGTKQSAPMFPQTSVRELWGMDLYTDTIYGDIDGNLFAMFTQAFTAMGGVLAIQILPNITLGLLLFMPLLVMVIVVVIKLLKK